MFSKFIIWIKVKRGFADCLTEFIFGLAGGRNRGQMFRIR